MTGRIKMSEWKNIFVCLCLISPLGVTAQEYSEQSLKTLFTSQQERKTLENNRRGNYYSNQQESAVSSSVQINGILKRSNGKSVVWLNGKSTMDNSMVDGVKVYSNSINDKFKIPVIIDGRKVYIKPGETWSEDTGISDTTN